jgi:hypothetical protein
MSGDDAAKRNVTGNPNCGANVSAVVLAPLVQ